MSLQRRRRTSTLTWVATGGAAALTLHSWVNTRLLRTPARTCGEAPAAEPPAPREPVSVLMPVRDEAHRLEPHLRSVLATLSAYGTQAELVVLDDGSTDGSRELAERLVTESPGVRARVVEGAPLPDGWLGKPWACAQLAQLANPRSTAFVFVDADVELRPGALCTALSLLRSTGLDLVSPWPRQQSDTWAERLVQPLQQWSWLTTVPLRLAERSSRPSLAAANGQLLVVDRDAYERAGGHTAVRSDVLDDIALLRAVVRSGGYGAPVDGTSLASCRMYRGWDELRAGYTKSLWAAFGSPAGATAVVGGLGFLYVWPAVAALAGSPVGAVGYACGVVGRAVTAHRTGGHIWPDSLAHPFSVAVLAWLTAESFRGRRSGTLSWKRRSVVVTG